MPLCFMLRTATCLCVLQVLFALRDPEVAHLIPDEPTFIDTPTVPASSAIVTASEEVPQVQDLEVDLSKIDLAELEELPNCTNGELLLSAKFYKVTRHIEIQGPCNVTAYGTTLLVTATLKFVETARLDGKLSVRAMNALQGPCLAFKTDAFVAASAELHFTNCHNIVESSSYWDFDDGFDLMQISALDAEAAEVDGGAMNVRGSLMVMGTLIIRDCRTKDGKGGAIAVKQHFVHSSGNISIINSSAGKNGGGIYVEESFNNSGGKVEVSNSSAEQNGGGIYVLHNFANSGGKIEVSNSSAEQNGGGIYVYDNFANSGGNIKISGSSAKKYGGGIYVNENFEHLAGTIQISGSSAKENGGGIYVYANFQHSGGKIAVSNSSAAWYGGGIYVHKSFANSGGEIQISGSSAKFGGGICVEKFFANSGGKIEVSNSSANRQGGGIYVRDNFITSGGSLSVSNSSARHYGGGFYVGKNAVFANAAASFSQCHAQLEGGGFLTPGNVSLTNASLMFELATASDRSAALQASHLEQTGGDMTVYNSSASSEVISVLAAWVIDGGTFHIQDCKAANSFLMVAHQGARLHATEFVVVNSSAAGMLVSSGEVTMSNGKFNQTSSPQLRANVLKVTHLSVTGTEALISWASEESTVYDMDCDEAFGGYNGSDGIGCTKCDPGSVFVKNTMQKTIANRSSVQRCLPCPDNARICNVTTVEMLPGMMVGQNISRDFHCPNPLACPGGVISGNRNTSTPMCAPGYQDVGCAECTNDHARSNSNVFICQKCAEGTWRVKDIFLFLASDAVIFIVSAAGVVSAGRQNKNSTVYLNQLMAFAAVTAPALLAVKNTAAFVSLEQQLRSLRQLITFVSAPVQVGDAGESAATVSTACILRSMGMEPSLAASHFLSSVVYIVLMLCLAAKSGMSIAVVVCINCFLPKFCAAFGAYLICFKMEPARERHCLMGDNPLVSMTMACLAIMICFGVGPGSWIKMTRDKSLSDKPEVLFLTRSYRKGFETWEVERLVRKMLLKIISTTLPITLNPSTQMALVTFVLIASLLLHATEAPYAKATWNHIERSLLVVALLVVVLTTLCLANETHWARSDEVQIMLILVITSIIAIAGGLLSFLLIRELILERLPRPLDASEPIEPIEPTDGEDGEVSKG